MNTPDDVATADAFHLARFLTAQEPIFDTALVELRRGRKESHWVWFIFPQAAGLGTSPMAQRYAISSLEEARAYLSHPILGPRLLECCKALLDVDGRSAPEIMGSPDDLKLRSSMTLFSLAGCSHPEFDQVLTKYFEGKHDHRTLELLQNHPSANSLKSDVDRHFGDRP